MRPAPAGTCAGRATEETVAAAFRFGATVLAAERATGDGGLAALRAARRLEAGVANGRVPAARRTGLIAELLAAIPPSKEKKQAEAEEPRSNPFSVRQEEQKLLFRKQGNGFSRPSNYCDGPMVRSRSWRTEEEQ